VERGWGVNSSEDARHCSVLYIGKYFVIIPNRSWKPLLTRPSIVGGGGGGRRIQIKSVVQYCSQFICLFYFTSLFSDGNVSKQILSFVSTLVDDDTQDNAE
jgi:hypothetical protein